MAWVEIGSLKLTYDWQLIEQPVIGNELFRIRQTWQSRPIGKALISQIFATPYEVYGIKAFYPTSELKLIELPIPKDFLEAGLTVRYLALKLSTRTRVFDFNWTIHVDELHT